jgi:HEAT repeat protein
MRAPKFWPTPSAFGRACSRLLCALTVVFLFTSCAPLIILAQDGGTDSSGLTPLQLEIQKQRRRLNSSEPEERRDAVMRLGWLKRPESARVAAGALNDSEAIVRATAARSVLALPADEAAALLIPQLQDRDAFVRQETAYALGEARSRSAVPALLSVLEKDKDDGVRGAAAVALGQIGDQAAVKPLVEVLGRRVPAGGIINRVRRAKKNENEFVRRAAAHSLGQLGSSFAISALMDALNDSHNPDDVRREAAAALGSIGNPDAIGSLSAALTSRDPYLSKIAHEAFLKLKKLLDDEKKVQE